MRSAYLAWLAFGLGALSAVCTGTQVDPSGQATHRVVADAGQDRIVAPGTRVTLDGSRSTTGGVGGIYRWTQLAGATVALDDVRAVQTSFVAPTVSEATDLVFELSVSDGQTTDRARVTITVRPSGAAQSGALLSVTPAETFAARGPVGGPLSPADQQYVLTNSGDAALHWTASASQPWLTFLPAAGDLLPGETATVSVGFTAAVAELAAGTYTDTLQFTNAVNAAGDTQCAVIVSIGAGPGLVLQPGDGFSSAGPQSGPFEPASQDYTLVNQSDAPLDWTATATGDWVAIAPAGGTLESQQSVTVTIQLTENAGGLAPGMHIAEVRFSTGQTARDIHLGVMLAISNGSMHAASRTEGVAPLAVFFDATDPASGVVQPPGGAFASHRYTWDFGDDPNATWGPSGNRRNQATGYVAAHVFENPGLYRVTLTVTDPNGAVYNYNQGIGVLNFCGTTYYVSSSSGDDGYDGLSMARPFQSFAKAMSKLATNTRILFKRGDTWSFTAGKTISVRGPGIIGAYGTGEKPLLTQTVPGDLFAFTPGSADWRLMDFEAHGVGNNNGGGFVTSVASWQRCTMLNLTVDGWRTAYGNSYADTHSREIALANCEGRNSWSCIGFLGADRLAILGCYLHDCPATHVLRVWHAAKSVISDSAILRPGATRQALKFHNDAASHYPPTIFNVICDNTFLGDTYVVAIAPQDTGSYEVVDQLLFERNVINSTPNTQVGAYLDASHLTLRNNIINGNGAARYFRAIQISKGAANPVPESIHVYNNTIARTEESVPPGAEFTGIQIDAPASNTIVRSNIFYAPPSHQLLGGVVNASPSTIADHNLYGVNPLFVDPFNRDFHLQAESPAIGYGRASPDVWQDLDRYPRPISGANDAGSYQWH